MSEEERRLLKDIQRRLDRLEKNERYTFEKLVQFLDGRNIQFATDTGSMIGTASNQKLAFYGTTPVDQPETVSDPSGGATVDSEARNKIINIIDRLQELGLIK